MTNYAPVGPIAILEGLQERGVLGNYLLLIAPDILVHPSRYEALVAQLDNPFIIVDNGVIEQGFASSIAELHEAASIVGANAVVLPDVLRDMHGTIEASTAAAEQLDGAFDIMCVPQGSTEHQIAACAHELHDKLHPRYWGVARWIANELPSRLPTIRVLRELALNDREPCIHMLGMSQKLRDDINCVLEDGIMGIDSANPVVLGVHGVDLCKGYLHISRSQNGIIYWDQTVVNDLMVSNVEIMRQYVRPKEQA